MIVSIIMPVKNGEAHLEEGINSIVAQRVNNIELIVINDASTDSTSTILDRASQCAPFDIVCLTSGGIGPAGARNAGLAVAKGKYITFLDHDDLWPDARLQRHIDFLEANPGFDAVIGLVQTLAPSAERLRSAYVTPEKPTRFKPNMGACTFTRKIMRDSGGFDAQLRFGEDMDFLMKLSDIGASVHYLDSLALSYRLHESNMTLDQRSVRPSVFTLARRSINRRKNLVQL